MMTASNASLAMSNLFKWCLTPFISRWLRSNLSRDHAAGGARGARGDGADAPARFALRLERGACAVGVGFGDHDYEPDAVVEDAEHLILVDAAGALQPVEDGRAAPARAFD